MAVAGLMVAGCGKTSYKKTPGGMPYKLYRSKDTQLIKMGDHVKISFTQKVNDSLLYTTENGLPIYVPMVSQNTQKYDISELWTSLHRGDSIVTTQMMDTFINRSPQNIPAPFKKGDRIITLLKILEIFPSDSLARIDEQKEKNKSLAGEIKTVEKFLADKKISAIKTPSGAFVQVINPGTGREVDTSDMVTIRYTGTSWSGKRFDSNTDSSFGHVEPYTFPAGEQQMIKGFDEAVLMMRKGAVIKAYIPATLGYGATGNPPNIKPNEHLVFDIEITEVADKAPAPPMPPPQKVDVPQPKNK